MDKYVMMVKHIRDQVRPSEQLKATCCAFHLLRQCMRNYAENVCTYITGSDTAEYWDGLLVRTRKNLYNLGCIAESGSKAICDNTPKEITQVFNGIANGPDVPEQKDSSLLLFMDIVTQFS